MLAGLLIAAPLSKMSGSVAVGRVLSFLGLLRTSEEKRPPALIRRRDELLAQAPEPSTDALRVLAVNRQARYAHVSGNLPRPDETRGHPDAHRLTAEQKGGRRPHARRTAQLARTRRASARGGGSGAAGADG